MNMHNHTGRWSQHPPSWSRGTRDKRRFLFRRFILLIVGFIGIFFLALVIMTAVVLNFTGGEPPSLGAYALAACLAPFVFILLASIFGGWVFRRIGTPLVDIMAAADAVAEGDLSARVPEKGSGEFRRLARSFNRMTEELERAEQQRRNLTADVAHELRTPLQIIRGNLEGIQDGVYQPSPEHIAATLDEARLLARLVDDLQVLSLAEAGQLPLHRREILAADLLADVAAGFGGQAMADGIVLRVEIAPDQAELMINVDPDRMDQVLANLVANALRYTPSGGEIVLSASPFQGMTRLVVADSGVGIPADELPYVFDRFWKAEKARSRGEEAGSGLGLAIARQLVEAHGGKIEVESEVGRGTKFTIDNL